MSPKRFDWRELEPHVDHVLELDATRRAEYLATLPRDLSREVRHLLSEEAAEDRLVDRSIADVISGVVDRLGGTGEGFVVDGYRIVRELGKGGMGQVLLGESSERDPPRVAIKLVRWELADDAAQARFERERQVLEHVRHPDVAALLGGGLTDDGQPYLVLEYIDGRPLLTYCDDEQLDVDRRVQMFVGVVEAVAAIHEQGVVHRDLKPENILVGDDGRARLLDFGIAKLVEAGGTSLQSPLAALTPRYAAPEQLVGGEISAATDLFSLGATLHELLVGSPPRSRVDEKASSLESLVADWMRPSEVPIREEKDNPGLARRKAELRGCDDPRTLGRLLRGDLERVLLRCLAAKPGQRFSGADVLARELETWLTGPRKRRWRLWPGAD